MESVRNIQIFGVYILKNQENNVIFNNSQGKVMVSGKINLISVWLHQLVFTSCVSFNPV